MEPNFTKYKCKLCHVSKPLSDYYVNKSGKYKGKRAHGKCKECMRGIQACYVSEHKEQEREKSKNYHNANRDILLPKMRQRRRNYKLLVLRHYSNDDNPYCSCCGENILAFLAIDHINNDGKKFRKKNKNYIYRHLINEGLPEGFRVLCHNCNMGRWLINARNQNNNMCPHELIRLNITEIE